MIKYSDERYSNKDIEKIMNPIVHAWFMYKFKDYSEPQRYAINSIHEGKNTLITAPTGTGKTLSAFGAILSELVTLDEKKKLEDRVYCIYVSPLKALNNDIDRNLNVPLEDLEKAFKKLGKKFNIRTAVRTGDTSQSDRSKMLKKPPHILITTPESLALLLTTKKFIEHLKDVKWLIVDEIHSLADNKRGVHLSLSLERLQSYAKNVVRIGLSATISPLEEVALFLVGLENNKPRDCNIVSVTYEKKLDLDIVMPVKNFIESDSEDLFKGIYKSLHEIIQKHKSIVVFTNTRAATERVVHNLKETYSKFYGEHNLAAHHSSLSRELRLLTEERLKKGELKVVVSSTSLELGIDIGYVDAVVLINSPKSIARALQRFGRSGHNLHDKIKGYFIVTDYDELVECSVIKKSALESQIDKIKIITNSYDVLTQHLFGLAIENVQNVDKVFELVKKSYCYRDLNIDNYIKILQFLSGHYVSLEQRNVYGKIWLDLDTRQFGKKGKNARMLYMTNIGVIPDEAKVDVKLSEFYIGSLDELFVERLRKGDVFVLGGQTYEFMYLRGLKATVKAAYAKPPTVPAWYSEMLPLSFDLANKINELRSIMKNFFIENTNKKKVINYLEDYLHETDNSILNIIYDYFSTQYLFDSRLPCKELLTIERFEDHDVHYVFHSLVGRKVNDVFSTILGYIISKQIHRDIELSVTDNGFMLSSDVRFNLEKAYNDFLNLKEEELDLVLSKAIESSILFNNRFRHNAVRSLMILRNYKGKSKSAGKQTIAAKFLIKAVESVDPKFPILEETRREIKYDVMDLENAKKIFKDLQKKKIKWQILQYKNPSLFAVSIVSHGLSNIVRVEDRLNYLKEIYFLVKNKKN